jgi:ABC-type branched-subunit amino acid transport system ATPase component
MNEPSVIVRAEHVTKRYGGRTILDNVSLSVASGDIILLRGANGVGKTTLLNVLSGHTEPDAGEIAITTNRGWITFQYPTSRLAFIARWRRAAVVAAAGIRRVWQNCKLFPTLSLWENVAVAYPHQVGESIGGLLLRPLRSLRAARVSRRNAFALLDRLDLGHRSGSPGNSLSLGQEKRLAIARTMEGGGRLILMDEPLAGLDAEGRSLVLDLIGHFMAGKGNAVVIAEHVAAAAQLDAVATQRWDLEAGSVNVSRTMTVTGLSDESPWQLLTRHLSAAALEGLEHEDVRLPAGAVLLKLWDPNQPRSGSALAIRNLVVARDRRTVLGWEDRGGAVHGLSLDLAFGEVGVLVAPNGWGKTTLLETIAGLHRPNAGTVTVNGIAMDGMPPWARTRHGLRMLRARDVMFGSLTVAETLRLLRRPVSSYLGPFANARVARLSGGERRRLGLATLDGTGVALVDEPFSGLDSSGIEAAWSALRPKPGSARLLAIPERLKGAEL